MSTRHIVRIAPLHTSILITFVYSLVAALVILTGAVLLSVLDFHIEALDDLINDSALLISTALLNVTVIFLISLATSLIYNLLAKHLGGIEITLDDD